MLGRFLFTLGTFLSLFLATAGGEDLTAHITWTVTPATETYVNDQTRITFRKELGGFRLTRADPAKKDGTASFGYSGERGVITVYLMHRGPLGCRKGEDCAASQVESSQAEMKEAYGKYDLERSFRLKRRGSPRGRGVLYHFLAFPKPGDEPAFPEVGAFEVGEFVFCYRGSFVDKAGLADLAAFLRAFGAARM
jgi:hypothetical protein